MIRAAALRISLAALAAGLPLVGAVAAPESMQKPAPLALAPSTGEGGGTANVGVIGLGPNAAYAPIGPSIPTGYPALILEALETSEPLATGNAGQTVAAAVREFYRGREYSPIWTDETGIAPRAVSLMRAVVAVEADGLAPYDYVSPDVGALFDAANPADRARLEAALSWAYVRLVSDLASGRTVPNEVDPELFVHPHEVDPAAALAAALSTDDMEPLVATYAPQSDEYGKLKAALAALRAKRQEPAWPKMSSGPILRPGDQGARVAELQDVLAARGYVVASYGDVYDPLIDAAVTSFQTKHGLKPDGHFGPITNAALNTSVEQRIEQIKLNMERQRWMPSHLGARYALVNLADFRLEVVFHDEIVYETRVVVGTTAHRTPVFSDRMTYLEINPYWNIPPSIAREEILPQLRKDPAAVRDRGIRVFSSWAANATELDPMIIDWSLISGRGFPFKLRQDPGDGNALGRVKFMFPNKFNIYLHDTPSKSLFNRTMRAFSHGCIRVEDPFRLAKLLLSEDDRWTPERFEETLALGDRRVVNLPHPINVHLTYLTAWVDDAGEMQFRPDIYGRDKQLADALDASRASHVMASALDAQTEVVAPSTPSSALTD